MTPRKEESEGFNFEQFNEKILNIDDLEPNEELEDKDIPLSDEHIPVSIFGHTSFLPVGNSFPVNQQQLGNPETVIKNLKPYVSGDFARKEVSSLNDFLNEDFSNQKSNSAAVKEEPKSNATIVKKEPRQINYSAYGDDIREDGYDQYNLVTPNSNLTMQNVDFLLSESLRKQIGENYDKWEEKYFHKEFFITAIGSDSNLKIGLRDAILSFLGQENPSDKCTILMCSGNVDANGVIGGSSHWTALHLRIAEKENGAKVLESTFSNSILSRPYELIYDVLKEINDLKNLDQKGLEKLGLIEDLERNGFKYKGLNDNRKRALEALKGTRKDEVGNVIRDERGEAVHFEDSVGIEIDEVIKIQDAKQQKNAHDCGLFAVFNGLSLHFEDFNEEIEQFVTKWRIALRHEFDKKQIFNTVKRSFSDNYRNLIGGNDLQKFMESDNNPIFVKLIFLKNLWSFIDKNKEKINNEDFTESKLKEIENFFVLEMMSAANALQEARLEIVNFISPNLLREIISNDFYLKLLKNNFVAKSPDGRKINALESLLGFFALDFQKDSDWKDFIFAAKKIIEQECKEEKFFRTENSSLDSSNLSLEGTGIQIPPVLKQQNPPELRKNAVLDKEYLVDTEDFSNIILTLPKILGGLEKQDDLFILSQLEEDYGINEIVAGIMNEIEPEDFQKDNLGLHSYFAICKDTNEQTEDTIIDPLPAFLVSLRRKTKDSKELQIFTVGLGDKVEDFKKLIKEQLKNNFEIDFEIILEDFEFSTSKFVDNIYQSKILEFIRLILHKEGKLKDVTPDFINKFDNSIKKSFLSLGIFGDDIDKTLPKVKHKISTTEGIESEFSVEAKSLFDNGMLFYEENIADKILLKIENFSAVEKLQFLKSLQDTAVKFIAESEADFKQSYWEAYNNRTNFHQLFFDVFVKFLKDNEIFDKLKEYISDPRCEFIEAVFSNYYKPFDEENIFAKINPLLKNPSKENIANFLEIFSYKVKVGDFLSSCESLQDFFKGKLGKIAENIFARTVILGDEIDKYAEDIFAEIADKDLKNSIFYCVKEQDSVQTSKNGAELTEIYPYLFVATNQIGNDLVVNLLAEEELLKSSEIFKEKIVYYLKNQNLNLNCNIQVNFFNFNKINPSQESRIAQMVTLIIKMDIDLKHESWKEFYNQFMTKVFPRFNENKQSLEDKKAPVETPKVDIKQDLYSKIETIPTAIDIIKPILLSDKLSLFDKLKGAIKWQKSCQKYLEEKLSHITQAQQDFNNVFKEIYKKIFTEISDFMIPKGASSTHAIYVGNKIQSENFIEFVANCTNESREGPLDALLALLQNFNQTEIEMLSAVLNSLGIEEKIILPQENISNKKAVKRATDGIESAGKRKIEEVKWIYDFEENTKPKPETVTQKNPEQNAVYIALVGVNLSGKIPSFNEDNIASLDERLKYAIDSQKLCQEYIKRLNDNKSWQKQEAEFYSSKFEEIYKKIFTEISDWFSTKYSQNQDVLDKEIFALVDKIKSENFIKFAANCANEDSKTSLHTLFNFYCHCNEVVIANLQKVFEELESKNNSIFKDALTLSTNNILGKKAIKRPFEGEVEEEGEFVDETKTKTKTKTKTENESDSPSHEVKPLGSGAKLNQNNNDNFKS